MTRFRHTLSSAAIASALLATLSLPSFAQQAPSTPEGASPMPHQQWNGEKRAQRMEHMKQRLDKFKADLKLTSAQQPAWDAYIAAMKPGQKWIPF